MGSILTRLIEALTLKRRSGYASAQSQTVYETPSIPLTDVMRLYERDPACKASVDLLAASAVGMGFYTTVNEKYAKAGEAKRLIDQFNEEASLDILLCDMARVLIACGNDFWLRITPERLTSLQRLPVDAIEKIEYSLIREDGLKIPYKVEGYKLRLAYGGETLNPEAVIHWRINCLGSSSFGTGVLQVLLHTLAFFSDRRPAYAWIKAKIECIMPKIFEKYAGPDVLALLERADAGTIQKFEKAIKSRLPPPRKIFAMKRVEETCGVIVYSHPPPTMFGRSQVWKGNHQQLQEQISTITRVIIQPKYRAIGLGTKLVKETLPLAGTPYVETLAVMAKYNPFFEKAGMQKITESKPNHHLREAIEKLEDLGFKPCMLQSRKYNLEKINEIGKSEVIKILIELSEKGAIPRKRIVSTSKTYPSHTEFKEKIKKLNDEELAKALKTLSFLIQTKVYLFWARNSDVKFSPHTI